MQLAKLSTISVPNVTAGTGAIAPALITQAAFVPLRVLVRNISVAATVTLSYDSASLSNLSSGAGVYQLPPGFADSFVVAPDQKFYVAANAVAGRISVAISEAFPTD